MIKLCDAVFEGGGMRGIGHLGAISKFEQEGYSFRNVAGASAGAIIASLLAAGYTAQEIYDEMTSVNFGKFFKHPAMFENLSVHKKSGTAKTPGLFSAGPFEKWLEEFLAKKNVRTFSDVGSRLKITASDITDEKGIVLPDSLVDFGIDPKTFKVAAAVRMSMGIPLYFAPYPLADTKGKTHYIIDGGIVANYPIWTFDDGIKKLDVPIFGFRFIHHPMQKDNTKKLKFFDYIQQLVFTAIEAQTTNYNNLIHGDDKRTIHIDTKVNGVNTGITDFHMKPNQVKSLFDNGYMAAEQFLSTWNFNKWNRQFREQPPEPKKLSTIQKMPDQAAAHSSPSVEELL